MTCVNILCTSSTVPRRILWSRRPSRWALQASRLTSFAPPSLTLPLKHRTTPPRPGGLAAAGSTHAGHHQRRPTAQNLSL